MRKSEWILSVVVIGAIGAALAGAFDRDASSRLPAIPAALTGSSGGCGGCCQDSNEAKPDEAAQATAVSDSGGRCAMAGGAAMAKSEGCGGGSDGLEAVLASDSSSCPYATLAAAELASSTDGSCSADSKCCSDDGKCCKKGSAVAEAGHECKGDSCPSSQGVKATTVSQETASEKPKCCSDDGKCCKKDSNVAEAGHECKGDSCPSSQGVKATAVSQETASEKPKCCSDDGKCCKKDKAAADCDACPTEKAVEAKEPAEKEESPAKKTADDESVAVNE